jgi:peptidoglycan/xylan/chitin deacetylase (PgdA/CDA1 family)
VTTVLTFHRVVDAPERDHDVSWDSFRRLIDTISSVAIGLGEPWSRTIALTFDDATEDHLRAAQELHQRDLPATFFVPTGRVGEEGRLDSDQVRHLVSIGHDVGSHAVHHEPLAGVSTEHLRSEVRDSRTQLEELCQRPVFLFAPPGGIGHSALAVTLEAEGYRASRSLRWGIYRDPRKRWEIPCVPVTEYTWRRGWVSHAMERHSLPLGMSVGWAVKGALPPDLARTIRRTLGSHRTSGRE